MVSDVSSQGYCCSQMKGRLVLHHEARDYGVVWL